MLLQQLATAADTLFVRQVPPVRTTFEQVAFVASGLVSILLVVVVALLLVALLAMRRKLDDVLTQLRPLMEDAKAASREVREVVKDVKEMVDDSRATVKDVNQRVRQSVAGLTDNVGRLGALVGRVNDTAESMATIASTTMGGIKLGARAMGLGKRKKKSKPPAERPRLRRKD